MHIIPFFIVVLCNYSIEGAAVVDVDIRVRKSTQQIGVTGKEDGNISLYTLKAEGDNIIGRILDNKAVIYERVEDDGFQNLDVLYPKGSREPIIVKLGFKNSKLSFTYTYEYYYNFQEGWEKITEKFFTFTTKKLNEFKTDSKGVLTFPKYVNVDLNKRESNDAIDVECNKGGDDKWDIRYIPKSGYYIVAVIANGEVVWNLGEDCRMPSEVKLSISDDALVTLIFKDLDAKNPATVTYRLYPGLSEDTVSGHDDADITKKATLISSTEDGQEEDEQGVLEDQHQWTQGIDVTEEGKKKLDEHLQRKERGETQEEFVLTKTIEEKEIEEEEEEVEPEVDLEEVVLPDYYPDDYFKDLKPITLDIYNHETEGLVVKVKSYPKHSSTIHTCIPNKGYIINSLYDSQRGETVWKRYKNDKYTVAALVYTRKIQLIVLFVIDVDPNKSKVLYYRNLLSFGWRERYRESLDQCYLDTIIKGEWRISEKFV